MFDFGSISDIVDNVASGAANTAISGAINSHYNKELMEKADQINRNFTHDQYDLMVRGMVRAGLNPNTAMGAMSPAQGAHALSVGPGTPGIQGKSAERAMANAQERAVTSQTDLNDALARKAEAERQAIINKTPAEVNKMSTEIDKMRGEIQLNDAIKDNTILQRTLISKNIDLTTAQIKTERAKPGLMKSESAKNYASAALSQQEGERIKLVAKGLEIDLGYSNDTADIYNNLKKGLSEKTGLPESVIGGAAQALMKMLGYGTKYAGAKAVAKNITSSHGDTYNVRGSIYNSR